MKLHVGRLYHGTTLDTLPAFQAQLLNSSFWRQGRDFGKGLYTTPDLNQARKWAHEMAKKRARVGDFVQPCVLEVDLLEQLAADEARSQIVVYMGPSRLWAKFIYEHRLATTLSGDPCKDHPDVIMGPMADNDTGAIVKEELQLKHGFDWFYDKICRSRMNRKLSAKTLGSQVVFCSESWESKLALAGYYVYNEKGVWHRENAKRAQSI